MSAVVLLVPSGKGHTILKDPVIGGEESWRFLGSTIDTVDLLVKSLAVIWLEDAALIDLVTEMMYTL